MKSRQGAKQLLVTSFLAIAMLATLGTRTALGAYGQVSPAQAQQYAAIANDALGAQQQQPAAQSSDPFSSVQRIKVRSDAIIVTYSDKDGKGKHRTLVIDYSELVPGSAPTKAGAAASSTGGSGLSKMASGMTGGLPTGTLLKYGMLAMIGYTVLKKLRRVVRRVTRA